MLRKICTGCLAGLFLSVALNATPSISFSTNGQITVGGATPGGQVVVFSVSHTEREMTRHIVQFAEQAAAGSFTGDLKLTPTSVVPKSIWVAVDLTSGQTTIDAPAPYQPIQSSFDPVAGIREFSSTDSVSQRRQHLHLLLVRPGHGAWRATVIDGGPSDSGPGSDGEVQIDLLDFDQVGSQFVTIGAPNRILAGDVLVGIDPVQLEYFVYQVPSRKGGLL